MATSFQKKTRSKVIQIPGAKPSLYNNQLLISTGIPSLDALLGGGMAVGTVLLVEEDTYGSYGRLLLKYFCAEAVMTGHSLLLSSLDYDSQQLLKELPAPIVDDPGIDTGQESKEDSDMTIAWRYRHLPKFQSSPSSVKFGHYYDLTKSMEPELTNTIDIGTLQDNQFENLGDSAAINPKYGKLLQEIQNKINTGGFNTTVQTEKRNILRIALHSLGSPQWGENGGLTLDDHYDPSLPRFLLALRAILRSAFGVCVITMPTHLFCIEIKFKVNEEAYESMFHHECLGSRQTGRDRVYVRRLEKLCDTVVHLDSFVGSDKEKNPAYKEYHGLFNIRQLPRLNSLVCHMPDSLDLAFKLRRKKFTIEKLHLPPELSETASRSQEDPVPSMKPAAGCGTSTGKSKLEF